MSVREAEIFYFVVFVVVVQHSKVLFASPFSPHSLTDVEPPFQPRKVKVKKTDPSSEYKLGQELGR